MITYGEVAKLRSSRAADQSVLSLRVYVPQGSVGLRHAATEARHPGQCQTYWKRWRGGRCAEAAMFCRPGRCRARQPPGCSSQPGRAPTSSSSRLAQPDREVYLSCSQRDRRGAGAHSWRCPGRNG
jgi:hypothetical protein